MTELHFYVRLLTYAEAVNVIEKMKELGGQSNISIGGISLKGTKQQFESIVQFMEENCNRYELTKRHPTKVEQDILAELKAQS